MQNDHAMLVEYSADALERASQAVASDEPVFMVNLLRFHPWAIYEGESALERCSGRDAYFQRYAKAFAEAAKGADYGLFWIGNVKDVIVGAAGEQWDDLVIVRYASFALLRRILASPAYARDADPHRRAAVADWRFMVTTQPAPVR